MLSALLKHLLSSLRGRAGGLLGLARKGWDAIRSLFRGGIRSLLAPPLDPEQRASIERLGKRAEAVLREQAEKERRAAEKARAAAEKAAAAEDKAARSGESAAPTTEGAAAPPAPIVLPGADRTIRTTEVLKAVAPVAIRALVHALSKPARRRASPSLAAETV